LSRFLPQLRPRESAFSRHWNPAEVVLLFFPFLVFPQHHFPSWMFFFNVVPCAFSMRATSFFSYGDWLASSLSSFSKKARCWPSLKANARILTELENPSFKRVLSPLIHPLWLSPSQISSPNGIRPHSPLPIHSIPPSERPSTASRTLPISSKTAGRAPSSLLVLRFTNKRFLPG